MHVTSRPRRRTLAAAIVALLVGFGLLLGSATTAMAEGGKDKSEKIEAEKYPPPPTDEKTVPPKPPVTTPPELVKTGVAFSWQWLAASGLALLVIGGTLVIMRRRLSHD